MFFATYIQQEYDAILKEMERYQREADSCDETCRMVNFSAVLDRIRALKAIENAAIYPVLQSHEAMLSVLQEASQANTDLNAYIDDIIFIHVDEPHDLHMQRVAELANYLKGAKETNLAVLDAVCQHVNPETATMIDNLIRAQQSSARLISAR